MSDADLLTEYEAQIARMAIENAGLRRRLAAAEDAQVPEYCSGCRGERGAAGTLTAAAGGSRPGDVGAITRTPSDPTAKLCEDIERELVCAAWMTCGGKLKRIGGFGTMMCQACGYVCGLWQQDAWADILRPMPTEDDEKPGGDVATYVHGAFTNWNPEDQ